MLDISVLGGILSGHYQERSVQQAKMRVFKAKLVRYRGSVLPQRSGRNRDISVFGRIARVRTNETGSSAEPRQRETWLNDCGPRQHDPGRRRTFTGRIGQFRGGRSRGAFSSDKVNGIDGSGRTVSTRNQDQDEVNEYLSCSPMPLSRGP